MRVERLEPGDGVSYGRNYVADRPTWAATIPVGHADGYPRSAVNGCQVEIGGRLYRVVGAVSASHTIVEGGDEILLLCHLPRPLPFRLVLKRESRESPLSCSIT